MRFSYALAVVLTTCFISQARPTDFYVDPDYSGAVQNGQPATPWKALGGGSSVAWTAINSALANGDVNVCFSARLAGSDTNQPWSGELYIYRFDGSNHRLTLDGMSKYNVNDASPSWSNYSGLSHFQITGGYPVSTYGVQGPVNYITIRGFRVLSVNGQLLSYRCGSHVIVENNHFNALPGASIGAGVHIGDIPGMSDVTIRNNEIHDTEGEAIYVGGYSYTIGAPTTLDGVLIEGNHIYNVGVFGGEGDCIDIKAGIANAVVRNNICHDNQGGNATGVSTLSQKVIIEGNVIYNTVGYGAIATCADNIVRGNLLFNNHSGIYMSDNETVACDGGAVLNNTVHSSGYGLSLGVNGGGVTNFQAKNNLFMNNRSGLSGWGRASYTITNNDAFGNTTDFAYPFSPGYDPNIAAQNLSVDPLLVNPANPAGPDGKFFTADDGFALQAGSPVATAGTGGTYIGALPVSGSVVPLNSHHVGGIAMAIVHSGNQRAARATVSIVDATGDPVAGATVTGKWSGLTTKGAVAKVTGPEGTVEFGSGKTRKSGTFTFKVTNVTAAGYVYDASQNVVSQASISTAGVVSDSAPKLLEPRGRG